MTAASDRPLTSGGRFALVTLVVAVLVVAVLGLATSLGPGVVLAAGVAAGLAAAYARSLRRALR